MQAKSYFIPYLENGKYKTDTDFTHQVPYTRFFQFSIEKMSAMDKIAAGIKPDDEMVWIYEPFRDQSTDFIVYSSEEHLREQLARFIEFNTNLKNTTVFTAEFEGTVELFELNREFSAMVEPTIEFEFDKDRFLIIQFELEEDYHNALEMAIGEADQLEDFLEHNLKLMRNIDEHGTQFKLLASNTLKARAMKILRGGMNSDDVPVILSGALPHFVDDELYCWEANAAATIGVERARSRYFNAAQMLVALEETLF